MAKPSNKKKGVCILYYRAAHVHHRMQDITRDSLKYVICVCVHMEALLVAAVGKKNNDSASSAESNSDSNGEDDEVCVCVCEYV